MRSKKNQTREKTSRINKLKRKKKKRMQRIIAIISFLAVTAILTYVLYKKYKYTDLQYAVETSLTNGKGDVSLLRVQNISLVFNDTDMAIVEASGLSKNAPHSTTTLKGYYKKDFLNSWKLESVEKIEKTS